MTKNYLERPDVVKKLEGLKDFQIDTVNYVFRRLYTDPDRTSKFLIADEVGLGKTLVARGLIAKAVDYLWDTVERIDVVYICSNLNIAKQNIDRLNITDQHEFKHATRSTLLPVSITKLKEKKLNFISLTPKTSFDLRSSTGVMWERSLLFNILNREWDVQVSTLRNVMRGDAGKQSFKDTLKDFDATETIDADLEKDFVKALGNRSDIKELYDQAAEMIGNRRKNLTYPMKRKRNQFLGQLRSLLASTSLKALEPDLVILDEFQRFKYLLEEDSELSLLAQKLFDFPDVKVLLLSATPYKMYTIHGESDENHYEDFERTVEFLLDGDQKKILKLKKSIKSYRNAMLHLTLEKERSQTQLRSAKISIEDILKKIMVRTERLAVSADRNGMLGENCHHLTNLETRDLISFVDIDKLSRSLDVGDQVEYWKSAPYLMNFMDNYKMKRKLEEIIETEPELIIESLKISYPNMLHWDKIQNYQDVDLANARLRYLFETTVGTGNWKQLWLNPSLPYYRPQGPFADISEKGQTKTLIFSSWRVVPKALSTLLSYEAERNIVVGAKDDFSYSNLLYERNPLLNFSFSQGRFTGMSVFNLIYPCVTLAKEIDPLVTGRELGEDIYSLIYIWEKTKLRIESLLDQISLNDIQDQESQTEDERWYWAALLLLDKYYHPNIVGEWFNTQDQDLNWNSMLDVDDDDGESRFSEHVNELKEFFSDLSSLNLGKQPEDLMEVLTDIAIASPAVVALRGLLRVSPGNRNSIGGMAASAKTALGFRTLFNQPESIILLQNYYPDGAYWQKVLKYGADGNLQSVLDEYVHILLESLGLASHKDPDEVAIKIGDSINQALSIRAPSLRYDDIQVDDENQIILENKRSIRCRYALRFGSDDSSDIDGGSRDIDVRVAFNSPFKPFVLATTSVGQEGLDFHQYCHRVVHWNLPSNPVDLEQREGRVHRYKGHVIRRNIAKFYGFSSINYTKGDPIDPWKQLFAKAIVDRDDDNNDLIPFWIFEGENKIERVIPLFPLSREIGHFERLKNSLVVYRSIFGQPRQEELVEFMKENLTSDEVKELFEYSIIDLSPPTRH
jgi:hypothetical protein